MDIGKTILKYDEAGILQEVLFTPLVETKITGEEVRRLFAIEGNTEPTIKDNAKMVFATWLSALTNIELADTEQFELITETVNCLNYENETVKEIELLLSFKKKDE